MSGNAHRNRPRSTPCPTGCKFCECRPKDGKARRLFRNHNGHRHNPQRKRGGRRNKAKNVN